MKRESIEDIVLEVIECLPYAIIIAGILAIVAIVFFSL